MLGRASVHNYSCATYG